MHVLILNVTTYNTHEHFLKFMVFLMVCVFFTFLLPQANGQTCVNIGCTHPIDGLFWNLPIYFLGFFSKYECWVIDLIVSLYHFTFLCCHLHFCITRFHITMKCKKNSYDLFFNEICLIIIQINRFNSFKSY